MPSSNQHTSGHSDLLFFDGPGALRPVDQEPTTVDRGIFGIPNEDDEYTRGLTFIYDPSTGQPSAPSTSEESEDLINTSPHKFSISSDNTGSRIVYTPQSGSDDPTDLHSQVVSPKSVGSSDSGSCQDKANRPPPHSVSARATSGTITAPASPANLTPISMSLAFNSLPSDDPGPSNLNLDQDDFKFLEDEIQKTKEEEVSQRKGPRMTRTPKSAGSRHDPMGPRGSTRTGMDKAQLIEKTKLMRRLGVCLPCLVNHEPVSLGFSLDVLSCADI